MIQPSFRAAIRQQSCPISKTDRGEQTKCIFLGVWAGFLYLGGLIPKSLFSLLGIGRI